MAAHVILAGLIQPVMQSAASAAPTGVTLRAAPRSGGEAAAFDSQCIDQPDTQPPAPSPRSASRHRPYGVPPVGSGALAGPTVSGTDWMSVAASKTRTASTPTVKLLWLSTSEIRSRT